MGRKWAPALAAYLLLAAPPLVATAFKLSRREDVEWGGALLAVASIAFVLVLHSLGPLVVARAVHALVHRRQIELDWSRGRNRWRFGPPWRSAFFARHATKYIVLNAMLCGLVGLALCVVSYGMAFSTE